MPSPAANKVLLIYPGDIHALTKRLPLSLLYLAEHLRDGGFDPVILDMQVDSFDPAMLGGVVCAGISAITGEQIRYGLRAARQIRDLDPTVPLVWGGIHASIMPGQTIMHPLVDHIVFGEGEEAFVELVRALQAKADTTGIQNLIYRRGEEMVKNPVRPFITFNRRDRLPYDLLSLSRYQTATRVEYQSSRGCPHGCLFCYNRGFNQFKWRAKDAAIVLDELEEIAQRFDPRYIFFVDDEFFINLRRAEEILRGMVDRQFSFRYKACIRIDMINRLSPAFFDLLDRSGCLELPMGAESGSDRILTLIKKKITRSDILESAKRTRESVIIPQYSFMGGFPGETEQDLDATISCIGELWKINPSIKVNGLFFATPFPGTELFDLALRHGYRPPASLEEWGDIDFIMSAKNLSYVPPRLMKKLLAFAFLVRFKYLWMHSKTFTSDRRNRRSKKYWQFILFRIVFSPAALLFSLRWRLRFGGLPIDIALVRYLIGRIAD